MLLPNHPRRAFRLSELIIVIVIGAITLGLFVTGTATTCHYGSTRMQCANNMRQIVLASHTYAAEFVNDLPPLTSDMAKPNNDSYNGNIFFTLLPYMEEERVFANALQVSPSATWYALIAPSAARDSGSTISLPGYPLLCSSNFKTFLCPNDQTIVENSYSANQTSGTATAPGAGVAWAACSYAANYQVFGTENDFVSGKTGNYCGPKYAFDKIPDGRSYIVFFGEQISACGSGAGNLWAYPGIGNYSGPEYTSNALGGLPPLGIGNSIINRPGLTNSWAWAPVFANNNSKYGFTAGGNGGSIFEFNKAHPDDTPLTAPYAAGEFWDAPPQEEKTAAACDKSRLQSFHKGCVSLGIGDGSVRYVTPLISQATWYSAIMPADGTPLGSDW